MSESPKKTVFESVVRAALFICIFLIPVTAIVKMRDVSEQSERIRKAIHDHWNDRDSSNQEDTRDLNGNAENPVQLD